jgi:NADH-quinone oxidoreductase subunit L
MQNLTPLILLLPLLGFLVLGLAGRLLPRALISTVACGLILGSFALALVDLVSMIATPVADRTADITLFNWVFSGSLTINFGTLSDPLSAVMLVIVTGVGFLIHVYAIGYMEGDSGYWRFFSFMNLFVFAMALLVAADNFLFLLVGWALVGLASFLLIGFWYTRPSAVAAAQKAFVVNVIGDFGLMLAIFLLFVNFHTLSYNLLHAGAWTTNTQCPPEVVCRSVYPLSLNPSVITAIALLLFVAAAAKSAQLPLHVWLPDAMEGPTPVSALIHAATMVTAGVYLVARAAPIFSSSADARAVVAGIGGATALFAATIACRQNDIKRVLAYSTMSQLGYMFMGEAAGGYAFGIFHLMTHAFFKALLFMCAGAVIHALAGEQDMRKMGGLGRHMRAVSWMFAIGALALAAVFPLAGFWSKDDILAIVLQRGITSGSAGWYILYASGLVTAMFTGFYIFRLIFLVFCGAYRGDAVLAGHAEPHAAAPRSAGSGDHRAEGLHHVGAVMLVPMGILAVLSVVGGFINTPLNEALNAFLSPVLPSLNALQTGTGAFWLALGLGVISGPIGILIAWSRYGRGGAPSLAPSHNPLLVLWERKYYVDELYDHTIVRLVLWIGSVLRRGVEELTLDGGSRGTGAVISWASRGFRALQTGYARNYALAIFFGAALMVLYYVTRR